MNLIPIPWEGSPKKGAKNSEPINADKNDDKTLKTALTNFLKKYGAQKTNKETVLWQIMALITREDKLSTKDLASMELSFQELTLYLQRLKTKK